MRNLKDVADVVNVPKANITKAMLQNIRKYHKKVVVSCMYVIDFFCVNANGHSHLVFACMNLVGKCG